MDIRALIFDINGTLIDIETDERMEQAFRAAGHFLAYQGVHLGRWEVLDQYFKIMKEQLARSTEVYPEFDAVAVWKELVDRNATDYTRRLPAEKLRQLPLFLAELHRGVSRKRLTLYPQVEDVLTSLRKRFLLAIVSDAQSAYALTELNSVGLSGYFDPVIISGDYGYRKPDVRLFQAALDKLRVLPSQAVYIGNDSYRDIFGARQLGLKTILISHSPDTSTTEESRPDYMVRQFSELPQAIDFLTTP